MLIEHYGGAFPLWLAPEQVRVVPIADRHAEEAEALATKLRERGLRVAVDRTRETVPKKVRASQLMKVPYTVVMGDREIESGTVAVRDRQGHEVRDVRFEAFAAGAAKEARDRSLEGIDLQGLA